jgi:hypothetical protein
MTTALLHAAESGDLPRVKALLLALVGGDSVTGRGQAMLLSAQFGHLSTVQWLLEFGGSSITETNDQGKTVWDLLKKRLIERPSWLRFASPPTALLRVMLLQGDPPPELAAKLSPAMVKMVAEGPILRARIPAYLVQRHALLNAYCPLIAPLRALVQGYQEPNTEELWATGLGGAPKRARGDDVPTESPLSQKQRMK